ncbi:MAG: class IV adenylate cyclase [Methylococcaceae bacterium]|jgi:predicted adenylyl cyclase CyaB
MARNIEIKARVDNLQALIDLASPLANSLAVELEQDDTFFSCENGRLKLRTFPDGTGELIFYQRSDIQGPKESYYVLTPTSAPDSLRLALTQAYGQVGRVRKQRTLLIVGRTRMHFDRVEELGSFLELEVVLLDDEPLENGVNEAHLLMHKLGICEADLIEQAYVDLLQHNA